MSDAPHPAPDETERVHTVCSLCRIDGTCPNDGSWTPTASLILMRRGVVQFEQTKAADQLSREGQETGLDETERVAPGSAAYWERRCHEAWAKGDQDAYRILELRAESAHRRDALHHAWAERDRLRSELAELKAERDAEVGDCGNASPGNQLAMRSCGPTSHCTLPAGHAGWHRDKLTEAHWGKEWSDEAPADRGPLTPHPPPWPVDEP